MMESTAQRAVKFARALAAYFFLESLYCSFLDLSVMVLVIRLIICFSLVKSIDECELRLKLGAAAAASVHAIRSKFLRDRKSKPSSCRRRSQQHQFRPGLGIA